MIFFESDKVGKRWFQVEVYQDYIKNTDPRIPDQLIGGVEASYVVPYLRWDRKLGKYIRGGRVWTLTGKGARKYRQQIIDHLEGRYFNGDSEAN
jgi:hypothetical protein